MLQKVWGLLYSNNMVTIDLPPNLEEKTRQAILAYLGSGHRTGSSTPLTTLR